MQLARGECHTHQHIQNAVEERLVEEVPCQLQAPRVRFGVRGALLPQLEADTPGSGLVHLGQLQHLSLHLPVKQKRSAPVFVHTCPACLQGLRTMMTGNCAKI